jgi:hypothetical protein
MNTPAPLKTVKPYAKFVIDANTCLRVCYLDGKPMIRISDSIDLTEKRGGKVHVERGEEVEKSKSNTVFLTMNNFNKFHSIYPSLKSKLYEAEETEFHLTDYNLCDLDLELYKVTDIAVYACKGKITFKSYYTDVGNNHKDNYSVVYAQVVIPAASLAVFESVLEKVDMQLAKMPDSQSTILRVITKVVSQVMLSLLKGHGTFTADDMNCDYERFMKAYLTCHEELICAGYSANMVKKINAQLEHAKIASPVDIFPTVFQIAGCHSALIKSMQKLNLSNSAMF